MLYVTVHAASIVFWKKIELLIVNPGLAPQVSTETFPEDAAEFTRDIQAARQAADVVVVSVHWGDFTRPFVLTDH